MTTPDLQALDPELGIVLYTDGSSWAHDRSGGWAWLAIDYHGSEASASGAASDTTNNRMEMQAWIEGLNSLHEAHGPCCVLVYSDSQYVGFGFCDPSRQRKANADLWKELTKAGEKHEYVEFCHVKGHAKGDKKDLYNDRVDKMAGAARRGRQNDIYPFLHR